MNEYDRRLVLRYPPGFNVICLMLPVFVLCPPKEDDDNATNTMREAFEEALGKVGVHPILGGAIWRAYLRFEKDELEDAEETDADSAVISKALERRVQTNLGLSICSRKIYLGIWVIRPNVRSPHCSMTRGGHHVSVPGFRGGSTNTIPTIYGAINTHT